jgi:hypothetical protein
MKQLLIVLAIILVAIVVLVLFEFHAVLSIYFGGASV